MGFEKWISRDEEREIPEFKSHDEARKWFKAKYGNDFMLENSEMIDGEKMYFYILVHDRETWERGHKELEEQGYSSGMEFATAAQPIQIWESGGIHIVH